MNSPRTYIILVLILTTLGGAGLAYHQYTELVELRAAAMDSNERSEWQKKIADLEKANKDLQEQLAAARGARGDGTDEAMAAVEDRAAGDQPPADGGGRGGRGRGQFGQQFAAVRELMAKPEFQAALAVEQKAGLDSRYGSLFKNLNLPPEQLDKLKTLLLERQNAFQDVMAAARDQGIDPRTDRDAFNKLLTDARTSVNDNIKSLLGDSGYSQFTNYEQTMPQRNMVNTLQQRLAYSDTPLTSGQADQLVQILAANAPQTNNTNGNTDTGRRGGGGDLGGRMGFALGGFGGGGGGGMAALTGLVGPGTATITPAAVSQAQSVLSQQQVSALQQLQQQQQTAKQLEQMIRTTAQQATGNATNGQTNTGGNRRKGGGG